MGHPRSGVTKPQCAARALGDLIPGFYIYYESEVFIML